MNDSPRFFAILVFSGLFLPGCNVGPDYHKPENRVNAKFSGQKEGGYKSDEVIREWWRRFHDSQLNTLVARALAGNLDLKIAAARVDEARALRTSVRYDYFPTVSTVAGYTNTHSSLAQTGGLQLGPRDLEIYNVGLEATWEADFWGRVRRLNRAAMADVATAEAVRHDTMVLLTSEVARTYLEIRGLQRQLNVAHDNATNQQETVKIEEDKLQAGATSALPSARARSLLNTTLAAIPSIESAISRDIHRVAVLIGEQPTVLEAELSKAKPMPELPATIHIGDPAGLLRRRPDVEAAEKSLESATERIGVAVADLFPKVTFNGRAGIEANTLSGFGGPGIGYSAFGPRISWVAFDFGRYKALAEAAGARARGQFASYQKTVLGALEETENSLVDYGRLRVRQEYLRKAAKDAEQAASVAHEGKAVLDPLVISDADRTRLLAQSELAASETATATALVAIYKALGGWWEGK